MNFTFSGCSCKLSFPYTLLPKCSRRQFLPIIFKSREHCRMNYGTTPGIWAFPEGKFLQRRGGGGGGGGGCREREKWVVLSFSSSPVQIEETQISNTEAPACRVKLQSLNGCKLGIGRYPDFEYNAKGGGGEGIAENLSDGRLAVNFDVQRLYIPALTYRTTKFLGLPLPPFLSIGIVPEDFQGFIEPGTGKVELNFRAKFSFSVGSLYKPPPLLVETILTTEASNGDLRSGRGQRLDSEGFCRLVGVATVVPIDDSLINAFLGLPTECLAHMAAQIQVNGVELRSCKISSCKLQEGYGVYSASDDSRGILLVAPLSLSITPMTVLQDSSLGPHYGKLFEEGDVDDRFLIILFLLVEHARESSFWSPYLDMLPSTFGTPLWFTEDELSELKGTTLYHATKLQLQNLKALFNDKVKLLTESFLSFIGELHREIIFEDFLWANCIFWTRALSIPCPQSFVFPSHLPVQHEHRYLSQENHAEVQDSESTAEITDIKPSSSAGHLSSRRDGSKVVSTSEKSTAVWVEGLVPGIDFCNHDPAAKALWDVDDEKGSISGVPFSMCLIAGTDVVFHDEEEIRISYGNKGNEELLYLYGFVMENNPYDYIMMHYPKEALQHVDCAEAKLQLLEEQKLQLRWLLPTSLLENGFLNQGALTLDDNKKEWRSQMSGYSWSGHRKVPFYLDRLVFPGDLMAALRTIAMKEDELQCVVSLLKELSESGHQRQPSDEDVKAAIWEVCGDAGALQLLVDLLTTKIMELEEFSGTEACDTALLKEYSSTELPLQEQQEGASEHNDLSFERACPMTKNKWASIIYRRGQKRLVHLFLKEAEHVLQLSLSEE